MEPKNALAYYERNEDGSLRTAHIHVNPHSVLPERFLPGMQAADVRISNDLARKITTSDYEGAGDDEAR